MSALARLLSRYRTAVVLGLTVIYATCYVAIKAGLPFAPPLLFGGLRAFVAGGALLAFAWAVRQPVVPRHTVTVSLLALALTATTFTFGAMLLTPTETGTGIASVLGNTQPLITVILAAVFLGESLTRRKVLALVFGILGVTLTASPALASPGWVDVAGPLWALGAAVGAAFGSVIIKRMEPGRELLAVTGWQLLIGSVPLLAIGTVTEHVRTIVWTGVFVSVLLFLALVGTALASAVWFWLIQEDDLGRLTTFLFLVPILGLALASIVDRETIALAEGAGVFLTIVGVAIAAATPLTRAPNQAAVGTPKLAARPPTPVRRSPPG